MNDRAIVVCQEFDVILVFGGMNLTLNDSELLLFNNNSVTGDPS